MSPLRGFRCPPQAPTVGDTNEFEFCLNHCPHQCLPKSVLNIIIRTETENEHKGDMMSPTALSGCARRLKLSRSEDYWVEPEKLYAATRGSLYHGFVNQTLPNVTTERRIYKTVTKGPLAPWGISGRIDYYDHERKSIQDFKTMADRGTYILFNYGAKKEHAWQLNLYKWLMQGGHLDTPDGPQIFWPVEELQVHYCFMNRVISTGKRHIEKVNSYKKTGEVNLNFGKPFRLETSRRNLGNSAKGFPVVEITLDIPPIQIQSNASIELYLAKEGPPRVKAFREANYMPPGVLGDPDKGWECGFCEVFSNCMQYEEADLVVKALAKMAGGDEVQLAS